MNYNIKIYKKIFESTVLYYIISLILQKYANSRNRTLTVYGQMLLTDIFSLWCNITIVFTNKLSFKRFNCIKFKKKEIDYMQIH